MFRYKPIPCQTFCVKYRVACDSRSISLFVLGKHTRRHIAFEPRSPVRRAWQSQWSTPFPGFELTVPFVCILKGVKVRVRQRSFSTLQVFVTSPASKKSLPVLSSFNRGALLSSVPDVGTRYLLNWQILKLKHEIGTAGRLRNVSSDFRAVRRKSAKNPESNKEYPECSSH